MDKELQGKLVEILSSIQSATGKAADFAVEQLPDIAQSYVAYGRATTTAAVVFGVLSCAWALWAIRKSEDGRNEDIYVIGGMAATVVGMVAVLTNFSAMLLVWFAPKVWLLKEIGRLLK